MNIGDYCEELDASTPQGWLDGVKFKAMAGNEMQVGTPGRLLIIGESPAKGLEHEPAFTGRSGARLRILLDAWTDEAFRDQYDAFTLFPTHQAGWSEARAEQHAGRFRVLSDRVLLVGRVADAFGFGSVGYFQHSNGGKRGMEFGYANIPSLVADKWWSQAANQAKAAAFFGGILSQ